MLKAVGKISVEPHRGRIVLDMSPDFVKLYYWFITKHYWIRMGTPMHGSHVTIFSPIHHKIKIDWEYVKKKFHGESVEFEYDEDIVEGGYTKGFLMYYMRVYSKRLEYIKSDLGIVDNHKFKGLHITIGNGKSNSVFPDWPKMIVIDNSNSKTK